MAFEQPGVKNIRERKAYNEECHWRELEREQQCGYCGVIYKGLHALEQVDICKSQHLMEIHGKV